MTPRYANLNELAAMSCEEQVAERETYPLVDAQVRELRSRMGMDRETFGAQFGRSLSAVENFETGRIPSPGVFWKILIAAEERGWEDIASALRDHPRLQCAADCEIKKFLERASSLTKEAYAGSWPRVFYRTAQLDPVAA